jgi:hypothetical protein
LQDEDCRLLCILFDCDSVNLLILPSINEIRHVKRVHALPGDERVSQAKKCVISIETQCGGRLIDAALNDLLSKVH